MEDYESEGLLHEQFMRQASLTPDNIAIIDNKGRQVTYKQLDDWTTKLASHLKQKGLSEDRCAAIYMNKSLKYIVAYIAILKAGGAYLPVDTSYPQPLISAIISEAEPAAIISTSQQTKFLPDFQSRKGSVVPHVVLLENDWENWLLDLNEPDVTSPKAAFKMNPDNLAFIVYSSGTTGKPKGIAVPHRAAMFSYYWGNKKYPFTGQEREGCNVFFVWQILRPLINGHTTCIIPDEVIYDPKKLLFHMKERNLTRMLFTPSLLEAVLEEPEEVVKDGFQSMKQIWLCGEVVLVKLLERCLTLLPWLQVVNLYSISECHDVAFSDLTNFHKTVVVSGKVKSKFCPVGQLLPGITVHILDMENHVLQPVGVPGEICVSGPNLAMGYVKRPDLNLAKFLPLPPTIMSTGDGQTDPIKRRSSVKAARMYRSGDWGYLLGDGTLEICGRCDSLVKIRGYSIELSAVESALHALDTVRACVVLAQGEEGEDKRLVAYIVPEGSPLKRELRQALKKRIPFYMIPSYFVYLSEIPLVAASGKLDKSKLPALNLAESSVEAECLPSTEIEKKLAQLWMEVLQLKQIDIQESFFDMGGHSLLATKLLNLVNKEFNSNLTVKDLFKWPSLANMAELLKPRDHSPVPDVPNIDLRQELEMHDQDLDLEIQLRAFWRFSNYNEKRWMTGCVLITGTTGFLGAYVLKEMLTNTQASVFCLVRESSTQSADSRIRSNLQSYGLLPNSPDEATEEQLELEKIFNERVTTVKGDITLVRFGLAEADYSYLCSEIDYVIHAAAYVNLVYPYHAIYSPNVLGTQNVLLFSSQVKIKPIHYISTDAVFPDGLKDCKEDTNMMPFHDQLSTGYAQSKWVAEQLIMRAVQRGHPAIIYRLGNQSGDSYHAHWNPADFNLLMIRTIASLKCGPKVNWMVEMTPVDFTARVLGLMINRISRFQGKILHLTNNKPLNVSLLYAWMEAHGYPVEQVSYEEFRKRVEKSELDFAPQVLRLLLDMASSPEFFSSLTTLDNQKTQLMLKDIDLMYPNIDSSLLTLYFKKLADQKLIPQPLKFPYKSSDSSYIAGKVCVVTGASSGIGQAISVALAEAGCLVALAGRRVDQLKQVKAAIESFGGMAISVPTDVAKRDEFKKLVETTEVTLGPVQILINCAGCMYYTLMENCHEDEWERQIDVNCKGVVNGFGAVLPFMLPRGRGHIVNVSSDAGRKPFPGLSVYSGTKYFVEGFSQASRLELASTGVKITCIQPGDVRTPLQLAGTDSVAKEKYGPTSDLKMLEAEDIARAVLYAVNQPDHVAINEILIEPRESPT